jgi:hypothetical protein
MADVLNLVMLIAASAGSLAFGVLAAYAVFRIGFAAMRPQRTMPAAPVKTQPEPAQLV